MSDHDQPAPDEPSFDDPAHDDLRELLAEVRVTGPVPADVVTRLDATLGSLRDQRRADADRPSASVLVLRRRVGRALVAAAAVAVIGAGSYGIVHGSHQGSAGDSNASSAGGQADAEKVAPSAAAPGVRSPGALTHLSAAEKLTLRRSHFARDAATLMRTLSATDAVAGTAAGNASTPQTPAPAGTLDTRKQDSAQDLARSPAPPVTATPAPLAGTMDQMELAACPGPAAPGSVTLTASLDGVPVALVFRPPTASAQVVEAWTCDGASLLASAAVPR